MHRTVLGSIAAAAVALPMLTASPAQAVTRDWEAAGGAEITSDRTAVLNGERSRVVNLNLDLDVTGGDVIEFEVEGLGAGDTVFGQFEVVGSGAFTTGSATADGTVRVEFREVGTVEFARIILRDADGSSGDVTVSGATFSDVADTDPTPVVSTLYFDSTMVDPVVQRRSVIDDECGYYKVRVGVDNIGPDETADPSPWRVRINGRLVVNSVLQPGETATFARSFREDTGRKFIVVRNEDGIIDEDVVRTNCRG
jgi:hypothetical protein